MRLTAEELRRDVAQLLDVEPESVRDDDDLITHGLDSLRLMRLAGGWRRRGVEVTFADLAANPSVGAWLALLGEGGVSPEAATAAPDTPADPGSPAEEGTFPLATMQHAYWIGRSENQALGGVAAHLYVEFDHGTATGGETADPAPGSTALVDPALGPIALLDPALGPTALLDPALGPTALLDPALGSTALLDPARLETAARALVARHPMLRARVTDDGRQEILASPPQPVLRVEDLRDLDESAVAARLDVIRDSCSHQVLDIEAGQVFDLRLTLLPGGRARVHLDVDMVAADALSYRTLLADLAHLYEHPDRPLPELGYDYRRYLAERPPLRSAAAERARAYWDERIPDLPGAPDLPLRPEGPGATDGTEGTAPARDMTRVTRRHLWLAPEAKAGWTEQAHAHGVTPAMALATAFATVLAAWSAESRFLLNVPLFDREEIHPDVPRLVGDFTGSVLLDVDQSEPRTFLEHARALQARMHADAAHADQSGLNVLRDLSRARGEQVLASVVYTSALGLGELFDPAVTRLFGEPTWIISQGPQVLLDAQITEVRGGLLVNWDIRENAFPDGLADAMFGAYHDLVTRLGTHAEDWNRPLGNLTPASQLAVRDRANDTAAPRSHRRLHDGFFAHAAARPDAPAVLWGTDDQTDDQTDDETDDETDEPGTAGSPTGRLTYGRLADRALRVAAALSERGVRPGDRVGVTLPKGPDQVIAVLGVLAAGAAYVPVSVEQPPARRERIHTTAGIALVLDTDGGTGASPVAEALPLATAAAHPKPLDAPVPGSEDDTAYILFTSGSTGEPKGVELPHRAAMNTIDDLNTRFAIGADDRALGLSALDFDLSVYDIFGLLSAGGAVVVLPEEDRREAPRWVELVRRHRVSVVNCVPPLLDMLLTAGAAAGDGALGDSPRVVLLGGDWVTVDLPARLHAQVPACRFIALGGTTETAIHSTVYEVPAGTELPAEWRSVPYGTPLGNVRCRVVDERGRDRPDWVPGELWIGGDGVAAGYRGDPARTADRFPTVDGRTWYRTGDLARYLPDGTLEFLGRRDHQLKLRGFRIEAGEVEAALATAPGVRRAIVGIHGPALVAAVAAAPGTTPEQTVEHTRALLPPHMVPEHVVVLDEFPLTPNGKIDRRALTALWDRRPTDAAHNPPRTDVERVIAAIWSEALPDGTGPIGRDDDFLAVGGDSVLATAIVGHLREALDTTHVTVRAVFGTRTVAALARHLAERHDAPADLEQAAGLYLHVAALTDDEVAAALL
ncbi:amino acid adenylation domain-containing protein [Yinghuangia sp. ASG 101]|uniref:non-ribosomal peptide synthetase n=1 Tax=Yinghuangia sp. ASG 101 TaxID=2896848 RepID=UPI001E54A890|nr:non-ribosomal peptide synthetase [Yinghuangia sp. ASG 101]UGQ10831.1 amino acid adenylation domain-containing protein [Yinghuangia sp. ASG 101]